MLSLELMIKNAKERMKVPLKLVTNEKITETYRPKDLRRKNVKEDYYDKLAKTIIRDLQILYISGVISDREVGKVFSEIEPQGKISKSDIEYLEVYRLKMWEKYTSQEYLENNFDVARYSMSIYLSSTAFEKFREMYPQAGEVLLRFISKNPDEAYQKYKNGDLPTWDNVSDWEELAGKILDEMSIYNSPAEFDAVFKELAGGIDKPQNKKKDKKAYKYG